MAAETEFDDFREVGAVPGRPADNRRDDTLLADDELAAEWRGRWDEF